MGFISALRRRRGRTTLSIALGLVLLAAVATSQATHLSTDTEGHTTVDQTICAKDPATSGCLPAPPATQRLLQPSTRTGGAVCDARADAQRAGRISRPRPAPHAR